MLGRQGQYQMMDNVWKARRRKHFVTIQEYFNLKS